jgi:2-deoxy-D-gluconate 3-dehydrogenase
MTFDLTGKTVLVTGANAGFGQGISLALAKACGYIALVGVLCAKPDSLVA